MLILESILLLNDLLSNTITNITERILWIDETLKICYCIELSTKKLVITIRTLEEIDKGFEDGVYTILAEDYSDVVVDLNTLSSNRKEMLEKRYNIVCQIDNDANVPYCFQRKYRGKFIKEAMEKFNVPEKTVYQHLRRYWQGGRTIDALLDEYDNCGRSEVRNYKRKPGRKSEAAKAMDGYRGIIIDDTVKKIFQIGLKRYYQNNPLMTLAETFRNIKADNYRDKPWHEKPTYDQFYNWYRTNINKDAIAKSKFGKKNYQNNLKPLHSDTVYEGLFPGFRYLVDATIFPVFLVNRIFRDLVIGRPVVYFAVDEFTTLITGIHIGLHSESWEGYASLIYNTIEDKVKYCKMYDIEIPPEKWNVKGAPKVFYGDRGGFMSKHSQNLARHLRISIERAPSYTGSAKGPVERKFKIIEDMIKVYLPGIIMKKFRERGERDYRKNAKLDIKEFTQIVIEAVLERNAMVMENYPLEKELVQGGVEPSANEIWKQAYKNKTGKLQRVPENKLRYYLSRQGQASITERGISFKDMHYTCEFAESENWFSRVNKTWQVEIGYDPRCMNTILMYLDPKKSPVECHINRQMTSNDIYIDRTFEEIESYNNHSLIKNQSVYLDINDKIFAEGREKRLNTVKGAKEKSGESKISVNNIKENRSIERNLYDEQQALTKNPNNKVLETSLDNKVNDEVDGACLGSRKRLADFINNKVRNLK